METKPQKFNPNAGLHVKNVMSIIAVATLLLSFLLLLAPGIDYKAGTTAGIRIYPSGFNMGMMIFGSADWNGGVPNPGLLSAFIIMIVGLIAAGAMNWYEPSAILSVLCLITSSILWFCTVPLYGNTSATLGAAAWCLGIFNLLDAVFVFVGATYR
jgi:hypothetical protein